MTFMGKYSKIFYGQKRYEDIFYMTMVKKESTSIVEEKWECDVGSKSYDWEEIHLRMYYCSIETKLRSFYFKYFHRLVPANKFLCKIKKRDNDICAFCNEPDSIPHLFLKCKTVVTLWSNIEAFFKKKKIINMLTDFEKCFGCKQNNSSDQYFELRDSLYNFFKM